MVQKQHSLSAAPDEDSGDAAAQRMADLAAFARGVVHDLRNPLNVIEMNLYLLRQRVNEDPRSQRLLQRIALQVPAIEQMLAGYLAFDAAEHPTRQRVHPNELVSGVAEGMGLPDTCVLLTDLAEDVALIDADPKLLEAALRALIRNACRAMRYGGEVRVVTRASERGVQFVIQDEGPGIDPDVLPRVFEPYFTTWDDHAGMGLPLVARVARIHHGCARLETTPGEGTRAILELPLA